MVRLKTLIISGAVASLAMAALTVIFAILGAGLGQGELSSFAIFTTAAALNIMGLLATVLVVYWRFNIIYTGHMPSRWETTLSISIAVAAIVTAFDVATLLFSQFHQSNMAEHHQFGLLDSAFALWAISVFAHIFLFTAATNRKTLKPLASSSLPHAILQPVEMRVATPVSRVRSWTSPQPQYSWPSSPALSSASWEGKMAPSAASQVHLITIPMPTMTARESWPSSNNAFATLPTPADLHKMRTAPYHSLRAGSRRPMTRSSRRLEPIPGSRPTSMVADDMQRSPLQAIDANARQSMPASLTPKSRRPLVRSQSTPIYIFEDENSPPPPPPTPPTTTTTAPMSSATADASPELKRKRFSADHEAHIHPLFRTNNTLPPPKATVGTTLVASALAGQTISVRVLSSRTPSTRLRDAASVSSFASVRSTDGLAPDGLVDVV